MLHKMTNNGILFAVLRGKIVGSYDENAEFRRH